MLVTQRSVATTHAAYVSAVCMVTDRYVFYFCSAKIAAPAPLPFSAHAALRCIVSVVFCAFGKLRLRYYICCKPALLLVLRCFCLLFFLSRFGGGSVRTRTTTGIERYESGKSVNRIRAKKNPGSRMCSGVSRFPYSVWPYYTIRWPILSFLFMNGRKFL